MTQKLHQACLTILATPLEADEKRACLKSLALCYPEISVAEMERVLAKYLVRVDQDLDPPAVMYCLSKAEKELASSLYKGWSEQVLAEQRAECSKCKKSKKGFCREHSKYPYLGAIGGGATYSFTPTSIGVFASVKFSGETESHNLTDFSKI